LAFLDLVHTEQLCLHGIANSDFFEQILLLNQKLSHRSYDGALVEFATSSESIDIGLDRFVLVESGETAMDPRAAKIMKHWTDPFSIRQTGQSNGWTPPTDQSTIP
jgi:hypothetical protein